MTADAVVVVAFVVVVVVRGTVVVVTVTVVVVTGSGSEAALWRTASTNVTAPATMTAMPNQKRNVPNRERFFAFAFVIGISSVIIPGTGGGGGVAVVVNELVTGSASMSIRAAAVMG